MMSTMMNQLHDHHHQASIMQTSAVISSAIIHSSSTSATGASLSSSSSGSAAATASAADTAGLETFYLEDYLDCVENLPEDLQRSISHMRELDVTYQEILCELEDHEGNLQDIEPESDRVARKRVLLRIQRSLIKSQEIFDEKLQIAQQILDMIENKSRQLDVDYRNIGIRIAMSCGGVYHRGDHDINSELAFSKSEVQPERSSKRARRQRNDCLVSGNGLLGSSSSILIGREADHYHHRDYQQQQQHHPHNNNNNNNNSNQMGLDGKSLIVDVDHQDKDRMIMGMAFSSSSSSSTTNITSQLDAIITPYHQHHIQALTGQSQSTTAAVVSTSASTATTNATTSGNKKTKKKKRRSKAEMAAHLSDRHQTTSFSQQQHHLRGGNGSSAGISGGSDVIAQVGSSLGNNAAAMTNSTSSSIADDSLIDPDEPTYCLCQQISYGEMIGCDNDRCTIEWFHFSCVALTTKPKGKWYCPRCRGDRPNVPRPGVRT